MARDALSCAFAGSLTRIGVEPGVAPLDVLTNSDVTLHVQPELTCSHSGCHELDHLHMGDDHIRLPHGGAGAPADEVAAT